MSVAAGVITGLVLTALGLLHVYWAAGGSTGGDAAIPHKGHRPLFRPSPARTLGVGLLLFLAAWIVFDRVWGWIGGWAHTLSGLGIWVLVVVLAIRAVGDFRWIGFFKQARNTRFAQLDTWIYSPL